MGEIVLTYDLSRPSNVVVKGAFELSRSQLVHVEPGFRKRKGMYSVILFDIIPNSKGKSEYFVNIINPKYEKPSYRIEGYPEIEVGDSCVGELRCLNLKIKLTHKGIDATTNPDQVIKVKVAEDFQIGQGDLMQVHVSNRKVRRPMNSADNVSKMSVSWMKMAPPWVCKVLFVESDNSFFSKP
jgi:hypothetical protein